MNQPSLWRRLKRARVVQVLAVYLGASWVVLQIAELLGDALALPDWVLPVAVILLLIGLVVIMATAWIQSMPSTTAGEATGELPSDWAIAPRDAISSLRRGRLPHLTWGRSILGGIVVLALLFGGAGMYVGLSGGRAGFGPAEVAASEAADGIAVVPFDVRGEGLGIWREGMMDLLTNNMDGLGGFRTIDSRTVMARWAEHMGDRASADLERALAVARSTGALYALEGSVVGLGDDVRVSANVYALDTGEEVAQARVEGPADDVLRLVDELAVATMRDLLRHIGRAGAGDLNAETLTTTSLPALRAFLEGESHYRHSRFAEAVQAFERAVAEDTAFAIALVRLSEAYGWLEEASSERSLEYGRRAEAHADRLSPRYQFIMEGWSALNRGTADGVDALKAAVQKYPDDPEAWFLLAETYIHVGGATYGTLDDIRNAIERAVALDPGFAPYRAHQAHFAVLDGDRAAAEEALAAHRRLSGEEGDRRETELAIPLLLGDSAEVEAAIDSFRNASERETSLYLGTFARRHDRIHLDARVHAIYHNAIEVDPTAFQSFYAATLGEMERGADLAARVSPGSRGIFWGHANELWDVPPPAADDPAGPVEPALCQEPFNAFCSLYVGMAFARWGRAEEQAAVVASLRAHADSARAEDPESAETLGSYADVIEGTGLWRRGARRDGRALLERHHRRADVAGERARIELGWLEAAEGRPAQAVPHFRTATMDWPRPAGLYGLARMYRELGQDELAREAFQSLAAITRNADDLPRVQEIREALARESGS
jgi:tetratricopeptide (TPR) repeat protein